MQVYFCRVEYTVFAAYTQVYKSLSRPTELLVRPQTRL